MLRIAHKPATLGDSLEKEPIYPLGDEQDPDLRQSSVPTPGSPCSGLTPGVGVDRSTSEQYVFTD